MSTSNIQGFQHHPFTSTLPQHEHEYRSLFNIWLVIMTAIVFFLILSWYNFAFAVYNYYVNPNDTDQETLIGEIWTTLGFAAIWMIVVILMYITLNHFELLGSSSEDVTKEHPLLRDEIRTVRDVATDVARL